MGTRNSGTKKYKKAGTRFIVPTNKSGFDRSTTCSTKTHTFFILLIIAVSATIYLNSLKNDFVFDDLGLVKSNPYIRSLTNIPDSIRHMHYRPLRAISYTIDYYFTGLNPLGYHISNIIYHAITSVLVYLVAYLMMKNLHPRVASSRDTTHGASTPSRLIPLFAALIFASHPVHTDSVTYISGRRDILSTLFFFLGFYYFLRYRTNAKWIYIPLIFMSFFLGLSSKEMAVTLPLIFFAYDFYMYFNTRETRLNIAFFKDIGFTFKTVLLKYKYFYGPIIMVGIAFSYYAVFILNASRRVDWYGDNILLNFLTVGRVWIHSIKLLFFPVTLNADYSINAFHISESWLELRSLLSIAALVTISYVILRLLLNKVESSRSEDSRVTTPNSKLPTPNTRKTIAFCATWFFVTMLPVSHIIPHHELFAEHYLYLPSFGFCLLIALLINGALNMQQKLSSLQKYRYILYSLPVIAIILCSYRTIERNKDWKDEYTLWKKTCETVPDCARARNNLGTVYFDNGMIDEAIVEHAKAAEINPTYSKAFSNLGADYVRKGMFDEAIVMCESAIEFNSANTSAYNTLGASYFSKGMIDEAIEACTIALKINPNYPGAYLNLGSVYLSAGMVDEGISACKKSINLNPNIPEAHFNLSIAFMGKEMLDEAIEELKKALRLKPTYAKARRNLAIVYKKKGLEMDTEHEFAIASEAKP
ncbi:MAG: tetratricopeptide repeat protein [Candidatus Brocadiales bacterium]